MVTIRENIAEFSFYLPHAREAFVAGDFNNWNARQLPMARTQGGYWVARMRLPAGVFKFRYYADGQWFTDYAAFGVEYGPFGFDGVLRIPRHSGALSLHAAGQRELAAVGA